GSGYISVRKDGKGSEWSYNFSLRTGVLNHDDVRCGEPPVIRRYQFPVIMGFSSVLLLKEI
ncbi:hypothetical protein STEG23_008293, partial [Scotinomys teguina]